MAKVTLREGETLDDLLGRFKREVKASGILDECRKREFFVSKPVKRRLKSAAAAQRSKKKSRK